MPLRRRQQDSPAPQSEAFTDSDEIDEEDDEDMLEGGEMGDEGEVIDGEDEEDEDEEEPLASPQLHPPETPIPPNLREISTLASWTVSSSKPGCSIPQLRSPSNTLFWQSDGPQPHYLNIHFFKLVRIVGLRLYLDFEADESYTPTKIIFLAGSGGNDLQEWGEMRLEQPRGWIWADFSGVGDADSSSGDSSSSDGERSDDELRVPGLADALTADHDGNTSDFENAQPAAVATPQQMAGTPLQHPHATPVFAPRLPPHHQHQHQHPLFSSPATVTPTQRAHARPPLQPLPAEPPPRKARKAKMPVLRAHLVQIKILENHQNGKDTHLRGLQIFARDNEGGREARRAPEPRKVEGGGVVMRSGRSGGGGLGMGMKGLGRSEWDVEGSIR